MLSPLAAWAAPPPVGSDDYRLLMPYSDAIHDALMPGGGRCCDVADGTAVDARIKGDGWEIRFLNDRFPDAPKGWVDVPASAVLRNWFNPTGAPIVWWYQGVIRCFAPAAGT